MSTSGETVLPARFFEAQIEQTPDELRIVKSYTYQDQQVDDRNLMNTVYKALVSGSLVDVDSVPVPIQLDADPDFPLCKARVFSLTPFGPNAARLVVTFIHYRFIVPGLDPEYQGDTSSNGYKVGNFDEIIVGPPVFESQTTLEDAETDSKSPDLLGSTDAIKNGTAPYTGGLVPIQVPWAYNWNPDTNQASSGGYSGYYFDSVIDAIKGISGTPEGLYQPARARTLNPIEAINVKQYVYTLGNGPDSLLNMLKQINSWRTGFIGAVNNDRFEWLGQTFEKRTLLVYDLNAITPDNNNTMLVTWRMAVRPYRGEGMEGGWDPWVAAVDPRTGTIPFGSRKIMQGASGYSGYSGFSGYSSVDTTKTNGFARASILFEQDFTKLPFF